ncbi:MAG: hypothetical protein IH975_09570 [Nitrospinae bacterium]|nr:hypothetical protein [Nitrospinota bacterium]
MKTLGPEVKEGDRLLCDVCAGSAFRLVRQKDQWAMEAIPAASCPVCGEVLELDTDVQPGDTVKHCGQAFHLSLDYGAWALEGEADS